MAKNKVKTGNFNYWQSEQFNNLCFSVNLSLLESLAINRFRWVGLPETCDARYLEKVLHQYGLATISHKLNTPDKWQSLRAIPFGEFDEYGNPKAWRANGDFDCDYPVNSLNGVLIYYSNTRMDQYAGILMYANKLTQYQRTEDVNLFHQRKPQIWVAPQEKRYELMNIAKQAAGFEPMILGDKAGLALDEKSVFTVDTQTPYIGEELTRAYQNTLNQFLMYIGIPHLAFEKGERMIEDEARANTAPTTINLKNCLDARRKACDELRKKYPATFSDLYVYFNDDFESYNFNYMNNVENLAQDGLLEGNENAI